MLFAKILRDKLTTKDQGIIIKYIEDRFGWHNIKKGSIFTIRKSNGITLKRLDIYVNEDHLIMPIEIRE